MAEKDEDGIVSDRDALMDKEQRLAERALGTAGARRVLSRETASKLADKTRGFNAREEDLTDATRLLKRLRGS